MLGQTEVLEVRAEAFTLILRVLQHGRSRYCYNDA